MVDQKEPHERSSNNALAFIVGGLVVAVAVIAWVMYGSDAGDGADGGGDINVEVNGDGGGEAADAVEDAAETVSGDADENTDAVDQ